MILMDWGPCRPFILSIHLHALLPYRTSRHPPAPQPAVLNLQSSTALVWPNAKTHTPRDQTRRVRWQGFQLIQVSYYFQLHLHQCIYVVALFFLNTWILYLFVNKVLVQYSCGSSSWNYFWTLPAITLYPGQATAGSLRCPTRRRLVSTEW